MEGSVVGTGQTERLNMVNKHLQCASFMFDSFRWTGFVLFLCSRFWNLWNAIHANKGTFFF